MDQNCLVQKHLHPKPARDETSLSVLLTSKSGRLHLFSEMSAIGTNQSYRQDAMRPSCPCSVNIFYSLVFYLPRSEPIEYHTDTPLSADKKKASKSAGLPIKYLYESLLLSMILY